MKFKPIKYNTGECRVKIKIEDSDGSQLENWTIMFSDLGMWVTMMRKKYGIEFKQKDQDLDWMK